jgi:hypothetical protein
VMMGAKFNDEGFGVSKRVRETHLRQH